MRDLSKRDVRITAPWAREILAKVNARRFSPTQSSLINLAHSATLLHMKSIAKGISFGEGGSPLDVACTALATAVKHQKERSQND